MPETPNVNLIQPQKPINQMTDVEIDAFADMLFGALAKDVDGQGGMIENPTP
jgi:hypothetical protein